MARILVCDDDAGIRELLAVALEFDHDVTLAVDGRDALDRLAADPAVDAVVLDVMMPRVDGYAALSQLRRNEDLADLPVVMLSARVSEDDAMAAYRAGADAYVTKPFDPETLESVIAGLLALAPAERRAQRETLRGQGH